MKLDTVDDVLASRTRLLTAYQDARYADRYRDFVNDITTRVAARKLDGGERFAREVALTLAKLMTYKDEYEVARLYTDPTFMQRLREQFSGDFSMTFNLAPPMLPGRDSSGRPKKRAFGPWMMSAFRLLAPMKFLRGTPFDPFGYFPERRMERRLIDEYRALVWRIVERLDQGNLERGIELASAATDVGGYGPVKDVSVERYEARLKTLLETFEARPSPPIFTRAETAGGSR